METTFLTTEQIWGDDRGRGQLQVMTGYGTKTGMSDLAIVLGGLMGSSNKTSDDQLSGSLWSASSYGYGYVRTVHDDGDGDYYAADRRLGGARPALPSSFTSLIKPREARLSRKIGDIEVMEYGEYPQTIAKPDAAKELNSLSADELEKIKTGKKYTFDGEKLDAYDKPFDEEKVRQNDPKYVHPEYQHNGKRYIRVEARPCDSHSVLSNGHRVEKGEKCWIEVQPIEWLKDPSGVWVARQALFSGVQFDRNREYDGNFAKTDMKQYLDNYFSKEMLSARDVDKAAHKSHREEQRARAMKNRAKRSQTPTSRILSYEATPRVMQYLETVSAWDSELGTGRYYRRTLADAFHQVRHSPREIENSEVYCNAALTIFAKQVIRDANMAHRTNRQECQEEIINALISSFPIPDFMRAIEIAQATHIGRLKVGDSPKRQ